MDRSKMEIIGWREWVHLPDLGVQWIKAKIDTGARTSSLHAFDLEISKRGRYDYASFTIHPQQRSTGLSLQCRTKIFEYRQVKSSSGHTSLRPVILTTVQLLGLTWPIEITLANRDEMGFRLLLGREAYKNKFLIDPGKSFYSAKKPSSKKKKST